MTSAGAGQSATGGVHFIPKGFRSLTPYLVISGAGQLIDFTKRVFGAAEILRVPTPDKSAVMHAEVKIGDSIIELADANAEHPPMPAALHVYVPDVDEAFRRAMDAGAKEIHEVADQPYGERGGGVTDASGTWWYIARAFGAHYVPERMHSVNVYLHTRGTGGFIEFLKNAFGGEEVEAVKQPDGVIVHAKIRIGDSILEMGEAKDQYQPMPTTLHLYVPDADAAFARAVRAGAKEHAPLKDQPYGERNGGVRDSQGNLWYIATHTHDVKF
jgi:PhnB protein